MPKNKKEEAIYLTIGVLLMVTVMTAFNKYRFMQSFSPAFSCLRSFRAAEGGRRMFNHIFFLFRPAPQARKGRKGFPAVQVSHDDRRAGRKRGVAAG